MIDICIVRQKGCIKANMYALYQHNHRMLENSSNKNIQKSLSKFNTYLVNNLQDGETFMKAFYRFRDNGLFKGQLKIQGDTDKQTKFLDEFLVYPPYQRITEMTLEEQNIFFKKYLDALQAYFSDIIILSAVVHRDEVFIPIDDGLKELYPEGKMTPHMHITAIPIVYDKKTVARKSLFQNFGRARIVIGSFKIICITLSVKSMDLTVGRSMIFANPRSIWK